jgi:hypothetical protein
MCRTHLPNLGSGHGCAPPQITSCRYSPPKPAPACGLWAGPEPCSLLYITGLQLRQPARIWIWARNLFESDIMAVV